MAAAPVKLHVTEAGSGSPALVFLHYMGGSGRTWTEVIDRLSGAQRCIAPDLRGWGASPQDCDQFGLEAMADDVAAMIEDLGLAEYVLVGHSMGGKISQMLAGRRPPGLVGLVLVAPAPPTPLNVPAESRQVALERYQSREGMREVFPILAERPLSPEVRERVIADTLGAAHGAKQAWFESGMDLDITAAAAATEAPTLVIVGTADQVETEASLRREFGRHLPHATFQVLQGVGHLAPLEAPDEVADTVGEICRSFAENRRSVSRPFLEVGCRARDGEFASDLGKPA